jgi:hypothetical protein
VKYLQRVKKAIQLILSNDASSLGLHPALYFYTAGGSFQPAALHNAMAWFLGLDKRGKLLQFLKVRKAFEDMIIAHPVIVKPAAHKLGSGARTRGRMLELFDRLLEILSKRAASPERVWKKLADEFPHLVADEKDEREASRGGKPGEKFGRGAKSAASLRSLPGLERCALCGGLLHRNGKVVDHATERSKGGSSAARNARWVHPICNSNREKMNAEGPEVVRSVQSRRDRAA